VRKAIEYIFLKRS